MKAAPSQAAGQCGRSTCRCAGSSGLAPRASVQGTHGALRSSAGPSQAVQAGRGACPLPTCLISSGFGTQ